MTTTTFILIAVAVAVMFLMHRVGRGAHAHAASGDGSGTAQEHLHDPQQIGGSRAVAVKESEQSQHDGQADEHQQRRHGCC
jgi:hypothetical protein